MTVPGNVFTMLRAHLTTEKFNGFAPVKKVTCTESFFSFYGTYPCSFVFSILGPQTHIIATEKHTSRRTHLCGSRSRAASKGSPSPYLLFSYGHGVFVVLTESGHFKVSLTFCLLFRERLEWPDRKETQEDKVIWYVLVLLQTCFARWIIIYLRHEKRKIVTATQCVLLGHPFWPNSSQVCYDKTIPRASRSV